MLLLLNYSFSQNTFEPPSEITSVIVYEKGAMVTRTIDTRDITSDGLVVIDSLPQNIKLKSIQSKCGSGLKIVSIRNSTQYTTITEDEKKDSLHALIAIVEDSIDYQNTLLKSVENEIGVILKNDRFSTDEGTNIAQLSQAADLYKTRLRALNLEQLKITKEKDRLADHKSRLYEKMSDLTVKHFKNLGVEIKIEHISDEDKGMTISYFSPDASWYTFYDLRVTENETESYLDHKAFVAQNTGEDWNEVKLTLSNRSPNKSINPPSISPYILQNIRHHGYSQPNRDPTKFQYGNGLVYGKVTDSSGEPLIGANVIWSGTVIGTVTDIDGNFKIQRVKNKKLGFSYTGFSTKEVEATNLSYLEVALDEGQLLDEIVVTGLGSSRDSRNSLYATEEVSFTKRKEKIIERKSISVKAQKSLNVHSFEILRPYAIPSDGEEYDVLLQSNIIPFEYQYITMPSIEPTAYLNIGIINWRNYNLFSGKVNLYLEGQYTGVSQLNIESKMDTLWFSLGEDIGIQIEKDVIEEYNKKSFLKNKTIELHTFDIIVKNNKNKPIKIDILDQVPISTDDDIKVKVLEISGAEYDEKKGFLTWKTELLPSESKTYRVSYEIKYGKHVDIVSN